MAQNGRDLGVPQVYAKAMLDLAAADPADGSEQALLDELNGLASLIADDAELATFFSSPLVEEKTRAVAIEKIFRGRASDLLVDALQVINRKGRMELLPAIAAAYRGELRRRRGEVDAHVTTAVPLTAAQRNSLTAALAGFTGRKPELIESVDASILGGLVVEVEGQKIDTSLARQLHDAGGMLTQRTAQQLHQDAATAAAATE